MTVDTFSGIRSGNKPLTQRPTRDRYETERKKSVTEELPITFVLGF